MKRFKRILLYAGTEEVTAALQRSVALAIENQAALTLMDVVPEARSSGWGKRLSVAELQRMVVDEHREKLRRLADQCADRGIPADVVVRIGKPAVEIVRQVLRGNHDLVVKSADRDASIPFFFSSVMKSLLRSCPCPVWALKPEAHGEFDSVLAAIDPESEDPQHASLNRNIVELALSLTRRENAILHLVGVWDLWMEAALRHHAGDEEVDTIVVSREQELQEAFGQLLKPHVEPTDRVKVHIRRGTPAKVIRAVAEEVEADLMVMGTVCRTGVAGALIGNTAEQLLSEVTCSVLAIKPEGFVTPIHLPEDETSGEASDLPLV